MIGNAGGALINSWGALIYWGGFLIFGGGNIHFLHAMFTSLIIKTFTLCSLDLIVFALLINLQEELSLVESCVIKKVFISKSKVKVKT